MPILETSIHWLVLLALVCSGVGMAGVQRTPSKCRVGSNEMVTQEERPHHYPQDDLPPDQVGKTYSEQPTGKPETPSDRRFLHALLLDNLYTVPADYRACSPRVNGGYSSVVSKTAYAKTLNDHRITPTTKSNSPFGYRPVNSMANHVIITTKMAAMPRKKRTM